MQQINTTKGPSTSRPNVKTGLTSSAGKRAPLETHHIHSAVDRLFELQSLAEIGSWVALQLEEMESDDKDPVAKRLRSHMGYFIRAIGNLADPAIELLDDIEADLRRRQ
ncbi:hypothetical protein MRBLRH8O_000143 [Agrobacterium radiobacter]|jgi:hypothetical protein|uniref:hypothetical protein n=1 Tax=Agrobacterium radiobacter TaxID=362 RepID=UPI0034674751